jgi:YidC/Oxa1 family membrane protein insertase
MLEWGPIKYLVQHFMLPFLTFCYTNVYANYGVAIILLTLVIKIAFYPLMTKQFESMRKMKELKPELDKLNEKYKNNPQEKQKAMVTLYRDKKVNPFQGCLPMVVQIPFFLAIYATILSESFTALIHQPDVNPGLFTFWLSDLSVADSTKILPILLAVFTYYSQKMMMVDQQQKLLLIMSPIFILIFGLKLPAGVVLYWAVQTLLSTLQQYWLMGRAVPVSSDGIITTKAKKVKTKRLK